MSTRHDDLYLVDIIEAAARVARAVSRQSREGFEQDEVVASAVQYHLIVVGEACGKLRPEALDLMPEVPVHAIRGFRNRLVHGYFSVNLEIVYEVATVHLPELSAHAEEALAMLFPATHAELLRRREEGLI